MTEEKIEFDMKARSEKVNELVDIMSKSIDRQYFNLNEFDIALIHLSLKVHLQCRYFQNDCTKSTKRKRYI